MVICWNTREWGGNRVGVYGNGVVICWVHGNGVGIGYMTMEW